MGKVDIRTKEYVSRPEVFSDLFNYYVYGGNEVIRSEDLLEMDTTELAFPDEGGVSRPEQRFRDVLKQAVVMEDDTAKYLLILGVENQRNVHYGMPVEAMVYDAMNYASQVDCLSRENKKNKRVHGDAEYLSGLRKEDKIFPVISLVLYLGQESWDAAETLHDMLTPVSESLRKYIPDYKINLLSPVTMTDEQLHLFRSDFKELATFIKYGKDKEKMKKLAEENEAFKHMDKLTAEIANDVTNAKLKIEANEKGEVDMCVAIMEIREEGRLQGREEGRLEGLEGIRNLFRSLILEILQKKGNVPAYLVEQIQAAEEEKELKQIFDDALQAETVEKFEEMMRGRQQIQESSY